MRVALRDAKGLGGTGPEGRLGQVGDGPANERILFGKSLICFKASENLVGVSARFEHVLAKRT